MVGTALDYDLAVIGGGPAGSSAAITAARAGARVLLAERGQLPRHKVCGEFVSPEALEHLAGLLDKTAIRSDAPRICCARIFLDGEMREAPVDPPALSLPRYELDYALWCAAETAGASVRQQLAVNAIRGAGPFTLITGEGEVRAGAVIDASGRWSSLSPEARASGSGEQGGRWLGLKAHYAEDQPAESVDLYFFEGGYCGVQPIAAGGINVCALVRAEVARNLQQVFARNRSLWRRSRAWEALTEAVSTSPVVFREPKPLRAGVVCAGDAAGFLDPFAGDGISLALHSGALAAGSLAPYLEGRAALTDAAQAYADKYRRAFLPAFRNAARLRQILSLPRPVRAPVLAALRSRRIGGWMVAATRARVQPR